MQNFKLFILSLFCFAQVKSVCIIPQYPGDTEVAPIYAQLFGRYTLELPYTKPDIVLQDGETIVAKCFTGFSLNSGNYYYFSINLETQTFIKLQCLQNNLNFEGEIIHPNDLKCKKLNWSMYEYNETQNWCNVDRGLAALSLAAKSNVAHHLLAEICFDLNVWSLQTITYNVTAPFENLEMLRNVVKTKLQSVDSVGENLWNLKTTNNFVLTELDLGLQLKEMSQSNSWLHLANYELSPIVQGKSYENFFKEYSNILNTIWWSNLRLGNWKRFMDTLENYAYNSSYQLYTGTSGVVRKPIYKKTDMSEDLTIKFGLNNKPIPAYIWTYLTSIDNTNKDFIIVGYNSPYAEFFPRTEIVFCPDICNEIRWLNEISDSFKYSTAGIMFCCTPESLLQNNPLNGFPIEVLKLRTNTITKQENQTFVKDFTNTEQSTTLNSIILNKIIFDESTENEVEESNEDEGENENEY